MRIVALQGSPRSDGHTQALLEIVLAAARQAGAQTEVVQLSERRNLVGCEECLSCQAPQDEPGCVIDDDMQEVHQKMLAADVIVWATPIFCWTPSWLLKMAMDRAFCLFTPSGDGSVTSRLAGRRMAAVFTAAGTAAENADLAGEALRRLAEYAGCPWLGACAAGDVTDRDSIRENAALREQAQAFGRRLAGSA